MDAKVLTRLALPDDLGYIVLYEWTSDFEIHRGNLTRTDNEGREIWRAKPPAEIRVKDDCFVAVRWSGNGLTANTFSSYLVSVDVTSGSVTLLQFTK